MATLQINASCTYYLFLRVQQVMLTIHTESRPPPASDSLEGQPALSGPVFHSSQLVWYVRAAYLELVILPD